MQPHPSHQKSKSPERALACRLDVEAGLNPAQIRVAIELFADHQQAYHSEFRDPGVVVWTAVAAHEPPGKPIKHCKVVPVELTMLHEADVDVLAEQGPVELRGLKLYRWCCEAKEQGGLLSQEDLARLLCVDPSTVKNIVSRLREQGLYPPTRGAIIDAGPDPSHKRIIARLLGRGRTTSEVASATNHGEHAIGRYQQQFGLVLHLLHRYPEGPDDDLWRISGLSPKAWRVYCEVARELLELPECLPHLERLRRRYELDPEGIARQVPQGKRPADLARRRLEQQTLATAIRQTVQHDLGTTVRVAEAVTDDLLLLVEKAFTVPEGLRPGEATIVVDAHDPDFVSGERVADRQVVTVTVPLHTERVQEIWRSDEPVGRRRARIAILIAMAAFEQGGVMTVAGLAELLHTSPGAMSKDLRELAVAAHLEAPTKGLIEDAGATLTHKDWIIELDQCGLTGEEIAWLTRHAPASRDRYIATFRRAEALMRLEGGIPGAGHLARLLRLRRHVAKQYVELLEHHHGPGRSAEKIAGTPA